MVAVELLEKLQGRFPVLAGIFGRHWETPLREFAPSLFEYKAGSIEPALLTSFQEEWQSAGVDEHIVAAALAQLKQNPVLQTSHHVTPTHGPTFLALDLISLSGLAPDAVYLVAANSGVAYSNSAWSGALSFGTLELADLLDSASSAFHKAEKSARDRRSHGDWDNRITLIPARMRDQLVYGSQLSAHQAALYSQFSPQLKALLPAITESGVYTHWATAACKAIQSRVLGRKNILIFDVNRVMTRYLVKVLSMAGSHPVSELLFDSAKGPGLLSAFEDPVMFLNTHQGKKSNKVNGLVWRKQGLDNLKTGYEKASKELLIQRLKAGELCPGVFLLFFVLRFVNGIRCLGSFNQVEYLERFRRIWQQVDADWDLRLSPDHDHSLTTGRLIRGGAEIWPLDLAIRGESIRIEEYQETEMKCFWAPILEQLTAKL